MNSALMLHRHAGPAVAGSYTLGAVAGATVTTSGLFLLSGLLSPIPPSARTVVAICGLVLLSLHAVGVLCLDLPQRKYQIPRETFTAAPATAAFRFAFELGIGMRTYITAVSPYAFALILVLKLPAGLGPATVAVVAGAFGYGIGRSIVVAGQSVRRSVAVDHPKAWLRAADMVTMATAVAIAVTV